MGKPAEKLDPFHSLHSYELRMARVESPLFRGDIGGTTYSIGNISESGARIENCAGDIAGNTFPIKILYGSVVIYEGEGKKVRSNRMDNYIAVAFSPYMDTEILSAIKNCLTAKEEIEADIRAEVKLPQAYVKIIADLENLLSKVKEKLDQLDRETHILSPEIKASYYKIAEAIIFPDIIEKISGFSRQMHDQVKDFQTEQYEAAKKFFQCHLLDYYRCSTFVSRSLAKPLGYAGDYQMMLQVYRNDFEGGTLFEKLMNRWAISDSSSQSLRLRRSYIADKIAEFVKSHTENLVVGSLACGPALEVCDFIKSASTPDLSRVTFFLMDQDQETLLAAKRNINHALLEKGTSNNTYILPISVEKFIQNDPLVQEVKKIGLDLIYAAGLYDYLEQPVAKDLTRRLVDALKSSGEIIIGNYHPDNPSQTITDFSENWRTVHREERQMHNLFEGCDVTHVNLHFDPLKIDCFLHGIKA